MIELFDYTILSFYHYIAVITNNRLTPFIRSVSYLCDADKLFPIMIISIILVLFKKTRRTGITMLLAMGIGLIFTNLVLKNLIARDRPYNSNINDYLNWWRFVGATIENEIYSFPSGHATSTMAACMALYLTVDNKYRFLSFIPVILICISRNYLMVHYPTDVLAGVLVGGIAAYLAYLLINKIRPSKN